MALTLLTRRDPFTEFDAMIRQAFPTTTGRRTTAARPEFAPAADIVRDGDDAVIALDAPGLDFERDITVELDGSSLVVSGERRDERAAASTGDGSDDGVGKGVTRLRKEVRYGAFRRTFTLPEHVTADALSATYDAGVLTVHVAGAYAGTEPQKIAVTGGAPAVSSVATVDADA